MKNFKGKVAVVTGAASGIGRALAERCAAEGMKVVMADIEGPALARAAEDLRGTGAEVLAVPTDVSKYADVAHLAEEAAVTFGSVHLLFNNAGVQTGQGLRFWEDSLNDWRWVLGVNLWGVIHGVKAFVPLMLAGKEPGHIVNTASVVGMTPNTAIGIYSTSKSAVIMFSECLSQQFQEEKIPIGVTVACPGNVKTQLNNAARNRPADLANPQEPPMTPQRQAVAEKFARHDAMGMSPEDFAGLVFDAVRQDRLYLVSHPEYEPRIRQRLEEILRGVLPAAPGHVVTDTPLD